MFIYTTAIKKMRAMTARKKVIQGGTSAGKTYGVIPILIDKAIKEPRLKITIVAETLPAVKEGALDIFKNVMFDTNRWFEDSWNASTLTYTFGNYSKIQFKSFDSVGKAKSSGKRDVLFLNEANHISFEIADALMIRSKETWIDFNPDNEFWVHQEVLKEPNSEFLLLTYLDNEACPKETIEDLHIKIEKAKTSDYWKNWCKVYIDGEIGSLQGTVFQYKLGSFPENRSEVVYGMDQGYTHPTAVVACLIDSKEKKIYLKEIFYKTESTTNEIFEAIKEEVQYNRIWCDSAVPMLIKELKNKGLYIKAVKKPKIVDSINVILNYDLIIDEKSVNLQSELKKYRWNSKDKDEPIDDNNHAIDAFRYAVSMMLSRNQSVSA